MQVVVIVFTRLFSVYACVAITIAYAYHTTGGENLTTVALSSHYFTNPRLRGLLEM